MRDEILLSVSSWRHRRGDAPHCEPRQPRGSSIEEVVDQLALALADKRGTLTSADSAHGAGNVVYPQVRVVASMAFRSQGNLARFETSGHATGSHLRRNDDLVEFKINESDRPKAWQIRAIRYKWRGFPLSTILTSLVDAEAYPASELVALYHETGSSSRPTTSSPPP